MIQYQRNYDENYVGLEQGEEPMIERRQHPEITAALRAADWNEFRRIRFDISSHGSWFRIFDEDLSGLKLRDMPADFLTFINCNFEGTDLSNTRFFPASFRGCDMRNVNLENSEGVANFFRCDLRGAVFNTKTDLFPRAQAQHPSEFQDCKLDDLLRAQLEKQGVRFAFSSRGQNDF